jgi:hypothetical protein
MRGAVKKYPYRRKEQHGIMIPELLLGDSYG